MSEILKPNSSITYLASLKQKKTYKYFKCIKFYKEISSKLSNKFYYLLISSIL